MLKLVSLQKYSSAAELWVTFGDEGGYSFLCVVALTGSYDRVHFGIELIRQAGLE